jgi:hypothetical protein
MLAGPPANRLTVECGGLFFWGMKTARSALPLLAGYRDARLVLYPRRAKRGGLGVVILYATPNPSVFRTYQRTRLAP